ncbi:MULTISPECIES: acyltransferase family protein [Neobacillus]|uniref:Acyltransferase family protein n=1 Tax=Neobacillus rhizophilus TaxID=2833579 RepID=A0A942YYF8_9BACI|nr:MULTISPECIES: acyltransferase family protein [Neobacillus]MBS4216090.1 acyltransferase family protein [Neobacillus rhizophilus]MBU8919916.1 acyltransferase family protein [Bacillus sp. FJAT-29953]
MAKSKRSKYFDNAKFILMFLVVFGHLISPLKDQDGFLFTLYTVIYLFHMPAFILISGYFSKGFQKPGYFKKLAIKLLIPYLLFQTIYSVYYYMNGKETAFHVDFFHPHWSLWFLLSLLFWNILLIPFSRMKWLGLALAIVLGVAIGYFNEAGSYLSLSRTFVFFPYFLLGFLLNEGHLKRILRGKYSLPTAMVVLLAAVISFGHSFPQDAVSWLLGDSSYAAMGIEHISAGVYRSLQYLLTLLMVFSFLTFIPSAQFKFTEIGERTLYIYLFHGFLIKPVQSVFPDQGFSSISGVYLFLIGFSFIVCLLLGSFLVKKYTKPLVEPKLPLTNAGGK